MVETIALQRIGADDRGATYVFDNERQGQFIVAHRKAGSISGKEYHEGRSQNKDPEMIIILSGEARLIWKDLITHETGAEHLIGPMQAIIPKMTWHAVEAITDFVMLELNSVQDCAVDTVKCSMPDAITAPEEAE